MEQPSKGPSRWFGRNTDGDTLPDACDRDDDNDGILDDGDGNGTPGDHPCTGGATTTVTTTVEP